MTTPSSPNCPICLQVGVKKFQIGTFPIFECTICQHRFLAVELDPEHVAQNYADTYFTGGDAGYDDYLANRQLVEEHSRRYAALMRRFSSSCGCCFAVGAAAGFDLVGFREAGWSIDGIEPNATMCRYAKDTLGFELRCGSLEALDVADCLYPTSGFDLVLALQVMAHFASPRTAAKQLSRLLKINGLLLVETWNYRSLTARLLGKHWHEYSPPTVVQWFTPASLEKLFQQFGLTKVAVGRPRKFIYGHHATSLLRYKLAAMPALRLATPALSLVPSSLKIPYPSEDLFWMLLRRTE